MIKPSLPKGTRDFTPREWAKRQKIIDTLRQIFERYGFEPLETPAMEKLEVLTGKYGEEGDKLIFKILESGDFLSKVPEDLWQTRDSKKWTPHIARKALRYDLTVPLARFTAMHRHELTFPFKRYQIQPVWRADRPQRGRFREFLQCDADILGSPSLWQEAELIHLYNDAFEALGLPVSIRVNNRKILNALVEALGLAAFKKDLLTALDKLDKAGWQKVEAEWAEVGIPSDQLEKLKDLLSAEGTNFERLQRLEEVVSDSRGIEEMRTLLEYADDLSHARLRFDPTLARGLDYYTGTIMEVGATDTALGSLGGGGRYDDLTGIFGLKDVSGVGISFGLDRIYLAMEEAGLLDEVPVPGPRVLAVNFGGNEAKKAWETVRALRKRGIPADFYPVKAKLKKQFQYADKKGIPYVLADGEDEIRKGIHNLKDMRTGTSREVDFEELVKILKSPDA
ncbi:MAG: histidine--tRNA ligase [Chlorobi bacterium]|nr:histidine--tRNA ligase [Chlorobiota bacterium]